MSVIYHIVARDDSNSGSGNSLDPSMVKLLIALLVLVFIAIMALGALMLLRSIRRTRRHSVASDTLPLYEKSGAFCSKRSNHRRLTISANSSSNSNGNRSESVYVIQEKQHLIASSSSPPPSPIPEIRITFPEEVDAAGKRHSGRVVVVRVGEHSVGLEPVKGEEDGLPPYMRGDESKWQSLDLDRMGGLKEKEYA